MNMTCYLVDDESDAIAILKDYIEDTPGLLLAGSTQDPLEALDTLTGKQAPDITFLDVDMHGLSGLELAGMVNLYTTVVFTTAFPQFALQAFEMEACDYLLKPIDYPKFSKCIQKVKRKIARFSKTGYQWQSDCFNIKSEYKGRMVRVKFDDVLYVEGADNYVKIHMDGETHITYLTMNDMLLFLPKEAFCRIHRSFILNMNHVRVVERGQVYLSNRFPVPLGEKYKQGFLDLMDAQLIPSGRTG